MRKNPICPFGDLAWKKYYWFYPRRTPHYEKSYWGEAVDPDGNKRNLLKEWDQQVKNRKHIAGFLKQVKPGRILDIGCGPGFLLSVLDKKWDKYGTDISKSKTALDICSKYARVYQGELPRINFNKKYFDVVVLNHVIEQLPKPLEYIKEIKRILKKGGVLIIETPDFDSGCARRFKKNFRLLHDSDHVSLFTSFSLVKMLEDYGFEIMRVEYPFFDSAYFTKENLLRLFDNKKVSPPFYGNNIFVCSRLTR
ncbi:MAG: class I SAM-dependent methyltransferase [Candidatus Yanofskybacteria bacterium]|nr:class I SAM-dependent methyltransferase [Candidatus Yanofskybacteria bacterium]